MKHILKIAVLTPIAALMFITDVSPELSPPYLQLVPEAEAATEQQAVAATHRRSRRRGVVVGASMEKRRSQEAAAASSQQQAATAQQQPGAASVGVGTVVSTLPAGCTPIQIGGVEYQHCGATYYRSAFQGNNLVYVSTQP